MNQKVADGLEVDPKMGDQRPAVPGVDRLIANSLEIDPAVFFQNLGRKKRQQASAKPAPSNEE